MNQTILKLKTLYAWQEKITRLMQNNMGDNSIILCQWAKDYWQDTTPNKTNETLNKVTHQYNQKQYNRAKYNKEKYKRHFLNNTERPIFINPPHLENTACFQAIGAGYFISKRTFTLVWIHQTTFLYTPFIEALMKHVKKTKDYYLLPMNVFKDWLDLEGSVKKLQWEAYQMTLPTWPTLYHHKPWHPNHDLMDRKLLKTYQKKYPNGLSRHDYKIVRKTCPSYVFDENLPNAA